MKQLFTCLLVILLSLQLTYGQNAIDFTFTDINADEHNLQNALDQGFIVMIDFFFVDCPPCIDSAPEIQAMHEDYQGKNVIIWSISDRDSDAYIEQFKSGLGLDYVAGGVQGGGNNIINTYAAEFNFTGFPTISIVCPDGSISWDIWPYTSGAPEWRGAIDACGVVDSDPYVPVNATAVTDFDALGNGLGIYPNPIQSTGTVDVELAESAEIKLEVYNLLGQRLNTLYQGVQAAGLQQIDINTDNLAEGTYLLQLSVNGVQSLTQKFTKL